MGEILTPDELAALHVPLGELPGFDPVGLRLYGSNPTIGGTADNGICAGGDFRPNDPDEEGPVDDVLVGFDMSVPTWMKRKLLHVNLADRATACRVAAWAAQRLHLELGCTAPQWACGWSHDGEQGWTLWGSGAEYWISWEDEESPLHDLDPFDDRKLPDGAQYVDRLALARFVVHVGSRP